MSLETILGVLEEKFQKVCDDHTDSCSVENDGVKIISIMRSYEDDDEEEHMVNVVTVVLAKPYSETDVGANSNVRECILDDGVSVEDAVKQVVPIVMGEMNKHLEDAGLPAVECDGIVGE